MKMQSVRWGQRWHAGCWAVGGDARVPAAQHGAQHNGHNQRTLLLAVGGRKCQNGGEEDDEGGAHRNVWVNRRNAG